jgi:SCY1-like protein 1
LQPLVREQTVKAVLAVVPKLSDRTINGELLRHLAKTANDEQPGIRTNTTVCLGKIARNLGSGSRTKVLTAAFARALRDPFVHARNAALQALAATADLFSEDDCATKILPGICPSLVDKEKLVRDQANKTLDLYLARVRKYSQGLPDTVQPLPGAAASAAPRIGNAQTDSSWAGWAISSFTNKLGAASGQMQTSANGNTVSSQPASRPSSVPPLSKPSSLPNPAAKPKHSLVPPKHTPANPFALANEPISTEEIADDFDTGWGDDMWGADAEGDETKEVEFDPFAPISESQPAATTSSAMFDDKGEPDFAGWLNAQQTKKTSSKPLPKGLAKSSTIRPSIGSKSSSTNNLPTNKPAVVVTRPKVVAKKVEQKKEEDEDEGWGDAWE